MFRLKSLRGDLGSGDEAGVARDLGLAGVGVGDLVDVRAPQAVLVAVLDEAARGVDHEDGRSGLGGSLSSTMIEAGMPVP